MISAREKQFVPSRKGQNQNEAKIPHSTFGRIRILPAIRALEVDESTDFPLEKYTSVYVTCQRHRNDNARIGWDYQIVKDYNEYKTIVTRTA